MSPAASWALVLLLVALVAAVWQLLAPSAAYASSGTLAPPAPTVELDEQTRRELAPRCEWAHKELNLLTGRLRTIDVCQRPAVWALTLRCPLTSETFPLVLACEPHASTPATCVTHLTEHLELVSAVRL